MTEHTTTGLSDHDAKVRRLIEADTMLTELRLHPGWQVYEQILGDSVEAWQTKMNSGRLTVGGDKPDADYRYVAGFLEGLRTARAAHDVVQAQLKRAQAAEREMDGVAPDEPWAYAGGVT